MTRWILLALLASAYTVQSYRMTRVWASDNAVWQQAIRVAPTPRALLNGGVYCAQGGDFSAAKSLFARAVAAGATAPAWDRYIVSSAVENLRVVPFIERLWARQHRAYTPCGVA